MRAKRAAQIDTTATPLRNGASASVAGTRRSEGKYL